MDNEDNRIIFFSCIKLDLIVKIGCHNLTKKCHFRPILKQEYKNIEAGWDTDLAEKTNLKVLSDREFRHSQSSASVRNQLYRFLLAKILPLLCEIGNLAC